MRGPACSQGEMVGCGRPHPEATQTVPVRYADMPRREWEALAGSVSCRMTDWVSAERSPLALAIPPASPCRGKHSVVCGEVEG